MRLKTIWTLPAMAFAERLRRTRDSLAMSVAARLPMRIRYWSAVQCISKVSQKPEFGHRHIMSITVDELMENLDRPKVIS